MKIFGFSISDTKKRFPGQEHYCIAYHDPRSLTWSWLLWWVPPWRLNNRSFPFPKWYSPIIGTWHFDTQKKMMRKSA